MALVFVALLLLAARVEAISPVPTCNVVANGGFEPTMSCPGGFSVDTTTGEVYLVNSEDAPPSIYQFSPAGVVLETLLGPVITTGSIVAQEYSFFEREPNTQNWFVLSNAVTSTSPTIIGEPYISAFTATVAIPTAVAPTPLSTISVGTCGPHPTLSGLPGASDSILAYDTVNNVIWITDPVNTRVCRLTFSGTAFAASPFGSGCACIQLTTGTENAAFVTVAAGNVYVGNFDSDLGSVASPSVLVYSGSNGNLLNTIMLPANPPSIAGCPYANAPSPFGYYRGIFQVDSLGNLVMAFNAYNGLIPPIFCFDMIYYVDVTTLTATVTLVSSTGFTYGTSSVALGCDGSVFFAGNGCVPALSSVNVFRLSCSFPGHTPQFESAQPGCPATVIGDPHIQGPGGERVDFFGKAGETYLLVDAPAFAVTMTMSKEHIDNHFVGHVNITVQNVSFSIATNTNFYPRDLRAIQKALLGTGATARFGVSRFEMVLELCPGVRLTVTHMTRKIPHLIYYLNVAFQTPGCHDDFDGVLGRMYQCRYAAAAGSFRWQRSAEETFAVHHQLAPKTGPCHDASSFGAALSKGQLIGKLH